MYHRPHYEGDCRNDYERFGDPDELRILFIAAPAMKKALTLYVKIDNDKRAGCEISADDWAEANGIGQYALGILKEY